MAEGVADDISHEGLRILLREAGVTYQRLKTWKTSKDPRYAAKKARVEYLYAIADREVPPAAGDPEVIFCFDEFGPLNLQPRAPACSVNVRVCLNRGPGGGGFRRGWCGRAGLRGRAGSRLL